MQQNNRVKDRFFMMNRLWLLVSVMAGLTVLLIAIRPEWTSGFLSTSREVQITSLRVAVLPDTKPEELQHRHASLIRYLSDTLQMPIELVIPANYDEMLVDFADGKIDLAFFGGYTFVLARQCCDALPLVMRDVDRNFTTVFIASAFDSRNSLQDFKGARFTFGAPLSTSGHLMPRYFLEQQGIIPEHFFGEIQYSGGHDKTAFLVQDQVVDLGAANSVIIGQMAQRDELSPNTLKIIWETPTYVDYVWAVPATLPASLVNQIRDVFLGLSKIDAAQSVVLEDQGAGGYLPAALSDFEVLINVVERQQQAGTPNP